jgi:multidrug efflux pump subunit AcrB
MLLSNAAIRNRTTVFVLVVLIVFAGAYSYVTLPRESAPDVKTPWVTVTTTQDGVSPEDIENTITKEVEKELAGLKGLKEITSLSAEGMSVVVLEFLPEIEIEDALQRVRDKVNIAKAEFPDQADEPIVKEINIAEFPIMMINISGSVSPVRLKAIAEELEEQLESVPGVLEVDVLGALEREIRIEIDPDRVASYNLTISELLALIPSENVNRSAGGLETEGMKINVRVPAEFEKPEDVYRLPLTTRNGRPIYLADVATVRDTFKDRLSYSRLDGRASITVAVKKRVGANIVAIARIAKAIIEEFRKRAPAGVAFDLTMDRSDDIHMMVSDLENNIVSGLVLVILVLVLFMGFRTSVIVALAIPMSMLISFAFIQAIGLTLNMIVLFSLILALGMLVDNAIVIVENIYRHMQMGKGRVQAAMEGTGEVAWPVITSTATTIAAFTPLLFWPGIVGDFMKYVPITAIVTLGSSLFVAMVISPVICSAFARAPRPTVGSREHAFKRGYRRLLETALRHRATTLMLAVFLLAAIAAVYVKRGAGREFFPDIDPNNATINIRAPQGTNIRETDRLARLLEQRVEAHRRAPDGYEKIEHVVATVGSEGGFRFQQSSGPHVANLSLVFPDYEDRKVPSAQVVADIRKATAGIAGAEIKVEKEEEGPPTGAPVTIRVIGKDLNVLEELSEEVYRRIEDVPNLVNLRSDLEAARPELKLRPARSRGVQLGVNTNVTAEFLKTANFGTKVGDFREFNDDYDITIRLPESQRTDIEDMLRLRVPSTTGGAVPLSSLGRFDYSPGLGTIHRVNQKRVVTLTADVEGRLDEEVLKDVQLRLSNLDLPAGYEIEYAGQKEEQEKAWAFLLKAFVIALLAIVGILVTQFNTLSAPLIIMTTVGLSTIGVFVGLLALNMPFGVVMTGVGVISLAGVVVNNAIVLLDYTRKLQRRGMTAVEAAVQAGVTRLRPVLLTAATTILGLIPMVTGISFNIHTFEWATRSESSQWWRSMASAVVFGLAFATVLTLVVVPTLYVSLYRVAQRLGLGGLHRAGEAVPARLELEDF